MSKYTVEVKLQAVEHSYKSPAESIGADKSLVINWVKLFEALGEIGLEGYTSYSSGFKLDVLNFMNETGASFRETASTFTITSPSTVYRWEQLLGDMVDKAINHLQPGDKVILHPDQGLQNQKNMLSITITSQ
ncbi:transposase [Sporosarcina sp. BP05]|uniref:transposase n=1 Tax=Sporosarcina sp. BP05 TaxID=2758726 RepID=UPI001645ABCF|nr:transposase [Sporosarcina sp. BP05]